VPVSDSSKRRPTFLKLASADVLHSFWVPQLAAKTDVILNRNIVMWIEPTESGTYVGNCAIMWLPFIDLGNSQWRLQDFLSDA